MSTSRYGQEPGVPPTPRSDDEDTEKPDLVAVFEHYGVIVSRSMVSCPLHEDYTASCSVNKGKGVWNCHSCGQGGDAWTLIQLKESVDFAGAKAFVEGLGLTTGRVVSNESTGSRYGGGQRSTSASATYKPSWRH